MYASADAPAANPAWLDYYNTPKARTKTVQISPLPTGQMGTDVTPTPAPAQITAPAPRPVASPTGQYSLMGTGSADSGAISPADIEPVPTPTDFLTKDDMYQALLRRLNTQEGQFRANQLRQGSLIDSNAVEQTSGLERQQGIDLHDLLENFAGRGMAYSGRYGQDRGDMSDAYAKRLSAVERGKTQGHTDMENSLADFLANKTDAVEQARADSLARRLAQYGV